MPTAIHQASETFQARFHRRWRHLKDPHVRALAWLLDAPDLLDPKAWQWQGKIASLPEDAGRAASSWLTGLDRAPAELHAFLDLQPFSRLGRYAEKLMAFYFQHEGMLFAHGVQVRAGKNSTVGEFDFLLRDGAHLVHWEFATKFYLLQSAGAQLAEGRRADYFVGPNLADTLGAKMNKILYRQLSLAGHPAAQIHLPRAVNAAQALVKGWLFYHLDDSLPDDPLGVSAGHCRGFWCEMEELEAVCAERFAVLPRLRWLAPAQVEASQAMDRGALRNCLAGHFEEDNMPLLVALLAMEGGQAIEIDRGFIVPDGWRRRAGDRIRQAAAAAA
jgi:uncharacterized protein